MSANSDTETSWDPIVVHLAAGEGTRLRPVTADRPKPLVELDGISILERNVATLRAAGVSDQVIVTGYRAEQIRELGFETVHNPIYDQTDMVYSLFCAEEVFSTDRDLIISYGDIVYERALVNSLRSCDAPMCVVVDRSWRDLWEARFDEPLNDAETLSIDRDGWITEIGRDPDKFADIDAQYVGLLRVRADKVEEFTNTYYRLSAPSDGGTGRTDVEMTHFIQHLIDDGWPVRSCTVDSGWLEVDTTADLDLYRDLFENGKLSRFVKLESRT